MKELDILEMIGETDVAYILNTQKLLSGEHHINKISAKRKWIVAAIIILSMTLIYCTVAYAHLQGWFGNYYSA